jgi:DNA-binding FadR family transcriptional regulator
MSSDVAAARSAPVWRPVRGGNAFEITVARLAQAIKLGLVVEGERLPAERDLAERLQVSRVTLREAIRALREAGYLESRRGRTGGTFVLPGARSSAGAEDSRTPKSRNAVVDGRSASSRAGANGRSASSRAGANGRSASSRAEDRVPAQRTRSARTVELTARTVVSAVPRTAAVELAREMGAALHDALDFRRVLEPGAAALAASRTLSSADRQHLVACLEASRERDPGVRRVADSRLHLTIAAASGSPSLQAAIADVQLTLDRLLSAIPVLRRNLDHSDSQHTRIVSAILAGDAAMARSAMEEHCDGTAELLRGLLS